MFETITKTRVLEIILFIICFGIISYIVDDFKNKIEMNIFNNSVKECASGKSFDPNGYYFMAKMATLNVVWAVAIGYVFVATWLYFAPEVAEEFTPERFIIMFIVLCIVIFIVMKFKS